MQQKRPAKLKDPISLWLILELKIKRLALVLHTLCLLVCTGILKTSLAGSGLMVRGQPLPTGILENLIIPEEGRRVASCILRSTDWNGMTSNVLVHVVTFAKPVVSQCDHGLRTHFDSMPKIWNPNIHSILDREPQCGDGWRSNDVNLTTVKGQCLP